MTEAETEDRAHGVVLVPKSKRWPAVLRPLRPDEIGPRGELPEVIEHGFIRYRRRADRFYTEE